MSTAIRMSPAAALMLNTTAIPLRKSCRSRHKPRQTMVSPLSTVDDLFNQWRNDSLAAFTPSYAGGLSMADALLDDLTLDFGQKLSIHTASMARTSLSFGPVPSSSVACSCPSESLPSLCQDNWSEPSWGSPSTTASLDSPPSIIAHEKQKRRPKSPIQIPLEPLDTHPLESARVLSDDGEGVPDEIALSLPSSSETASSRPGLRPVISQSLQTLKSRALSSLQSFSLQNRFILPGKRTKDSLDPGSSDCLWSHPHLFPRLSSEIRPQPFSEPPTISDRQYFNPVKPPTLDQQRVSYREALHPPATPESIVRGATPLIQLQPSSTGRGLKRRRPRKSGGCAESGPPSPPPHVSSSTVTPGIRRRELRENGDFLRVAVLEMNMRRSGKMDEDAVGRARIWLAPRSVVMVGGRQREHGGGDRGAIPDRLTPVAVDDSA